MKSIETIYQEMLADFTQRAGYRPGDTCDLAVRLYAMAAQVQTLLFQADWVVQQAFPQTATGEYLDYHAQSRGLQRRAAGAAEGVICFYAPENAAAELVIPVGTVCLTGAGVRFETVEEGRIAQGESWTEVRAVAVEKGHTGNVAAGSITLMVVPPVGVVRCDNPDPFAGGMDEEDDENLRNRILESFHRLPNGANAAFYEQEAMSVAGVVAATAVGRARGIGTVDVYVASAAGAPNQTLVNEITDLLQKKREIAVDVQVLPPVEQAVDVTVVIVPAAGFTNEEAAAAAERVLRGWFTGTLMGKGVKLAALGELLFHLKEIDNYRFIVPAEDIEGAVGVLPVLGTITLQTEG